MNAENEDDFLHRFPTSEKTNLTKRHAAVTFDSVYVRSRWIYAYFMLASTLCIKVAA